LPLADLVAQVHHETDSKPPSASVLSESLERYCRAQ
jgi:hypothetical protein